MAGCSVGPAITGGTRRRATRLPYRLGWLTIRFFESRPTSHTFCALFQKNTSRLWFWSANMPARVGRVGCRLDASEAKNTGEPGRLMLAWSESPLPCAPTARERDASCTLNGVVDVSPGRRRVRGFVGPGSNAARRLW